MRKPLRAIAAVLLSCGPLPGFLWAQKSRAPAPSAAAAAEKGIALSQRGACVEALPLLTSALPRLSDKKLLYAAAMARAKCGMDLGRMTDAVEALALLNREFPEDPEVLYTTVHAFSELSDRAADKLVATDTASPQAMELEAEILLSQGKPAEGIAKYRDILKQYPHTPGIHYRLGRVLLSGTPTAADKAEAQKEFEAELTLSPHSAATEFMLGDLAWQARNLPEAITRFTEAADDDVGFLEADLALGVALNATGKYQAAVAPLEKYVQGEPDDAAGHYQLAIAYARTGRKRESDEQMALQKTAAEKAQKARFRAKPDSGF